MACLHMAEAPIHIAVVGHTNAGKTSLLRTLTRRADFGEVSDRPGTTRHVEMVSLRAAGVAVQLADTPGLEDPVALLELVRAIPHTQTPTERVRAFLRRPEASAEFEQEAKVLRALLDADAAFYVIDCREAVLPKHHSEIALLQACATPVMPVLNHLRRPAQPPRRLARRAGRTRPARAGGLMTPWRRCWAPRCSCCATWPRCCLPTARR